MNTSACLIRVLCGLCIAAGLIGNASAEPAPAPAAASAPAPALAASSVPAGTAESGKPEPGEPVVRLTIIDDDNVRIEELKVRGRSQRIVVTPKNGSKPYEIITDNGSRDLSEGPNGFNGAVGKRVWPVLSF
jgi:3-oxoacyl-ACP reductase-like protein